MTRNAVVTAPPSTAEIVVLESFPAPRPTTNPYVTMLAERLRSEPRISLLTFSWRRALFARYDVFHVHWPETLFGAATPAKACAKRMLLFVLLLRLSLLRVPIVRTVHNVKRPDGLRRSEHLLLDMFDRRTAMRITLNDQTELPPGTPSTTIRHGHYRDWFETIPRQAARTGQLGFAGLIRRYKGVENLLAAFAATKTSAPELSLRVGGNPSTPELAEALRRVADTDERISLDLRFLSEPDLVSIVTSSELVVLPYRFMHNSGGMLAALSLDRPVLVPRNAVTTAIGREVGPGWVYQFDGELDAQDLAETLARLRTDVRTEHPNLDSRAWIEAGPRHAAAFRMALFQQRRGHA